MHRCGCCLLLILPLPVLARYLVMVGSTTLFPPKKFGTGLIDLLPLSFSLFFFNRLFFCSYFPPLERLLSLLVVEPLSLPLSLLALSWLLDSSLPLFSASDESLG